MKSIKNRIESYNEYSLACLDGNDVISAQVSDHHPIVHYNVLFWNVMMKAMLRKDKGFNNGFKMIENNSQYLQRLRLIAYVIAEIVYYQPQICAVGICEGPIEPDHVRTLFTTLNQFPWMRRLTANHDFYKPDMKHFNNWGLLMLADREFKVKKTPCPLVKKFSVSSELANRLQIWELDKNNQKQFLALAHFPFSRNEQAVSESALTAYGKVYCYLTAAILDSYAFNRLVFCADFNINPNLVKYKNRFLDKVPTNNSVLTPPEGSLSSEKFLSVTVDGILLSNQEKQFQLSALSCTNLFTHLTKELELAKGGDKNHLRSSL